MQIRQNDTGGKLAQTVGAIVADPQSWKGWSALYLSAVECSPDDFMDVEIMAKAVIKSYFQNTEGNAYFCNHKDIFILCKDTQYSVLEQASEDLKKLAFDKNRVVCGALIYPDLEKESHLFAGKIFGYDGRPLVQAPSPVNHEKDSPIEISEKTHHEGGPHLKILLVEDDPVTRWMIGNNLKNEGEITSVDTAGKVFSIYSRFRPDIVLLDIGLPDTNGQDVLSWIMRNDPMANVIILSGRSNADNISECIGKGAKGFVPKPFVREKLLHYIHKYG